MKPKNKSQATTAQMEPTEIVHREDCVSQYGPNPCNCRILDREDRLAAFEDKADARRKYGE